MAKLDYMQREAVGVQRSAAARSKLVRDAIADMRSAGLTVTAHDEIGSRGTTIVAAQESTEQTYDYARALVGAP